MAHTDTIDSQTAAGVTVFDFKFEVNASQQAVSDFHRDTSVLRKLTPPPVYVQIHQFEPLAEGSKALFTLWMGPLPIRWEAVHSDVGVHGFTDTQVAGPMAQWVHTHRFIPQGPNRTLVHEHIEYIHPPGLKGIGTRLLFAKPGLYAMFTYRKLRTIMGCK